MPISSGNDLTDTPRNSASPSLSPGKLPHEINHPKTLMPVRMLKTSHFMWDTYYWCHFFFIFRQMKHLFLYFLSLLCQVLSLLESNPVNHFRLWLMLGYKLVAILINVSENAHGAHVKQVRDAQSFIFTSLCMRGLWLRGEGNKYFLEENSVEYFSELKTVAERGVNVLAFMIVFLCVESWGICKYLQFAFLFK